MIKAVAVTIAGLAVGAAIVIAAGVNSFVGLPPQSHWDDREEEDRG